MFGPVWFGSVTLLQFGGSVKFLVQLNTIGIHWYFLVLICNLQIKSIKQFSEKFLVM